MSELLGTVDWNNHKELYQHGALQIAGYTNRGIARETKPNEDRFSIRRFTIGERTYSMLTVADGMGGHANGASAAETIARVLPQQVGESLQANADNPQAALIQGVKEADTRLFMENSIKRSDSGATLAAVLIDDQGNYYATRVGDARVLLMDEHSSVQSLFVDQSRVGQLVACGMIAPEDVYTHPDRNFVTASIGDLGNQPVEIQTGNLQGKTLVLCSDGLWEMIGRQEVRDAHRRGSLQPQSAINTEVAKILSSSPSLQASATKLVARANEYGGEDNITVVVAKMPQAEAMLGQTVRRV